ncbi:efflux RND transporter periplasmic adaptor subunit [Pseudoroseomonas cervicalis]|uniref:efflux RND transporter periplasmic adaptor subunit n=1 Tax=Teichococcus cervicalis TaxID=204525 RepID=UPI0027843097|nr:efflux RND transporter periplasmic adaptor subunit [Pseudoroseomonas cervicalis]MDQ1081705.1 RND family efflux transporter MFP subunit [Pseudoroseomonas cervicalis]
MRRNLFWAMLGTLATLAGAGAGAFALAGRARDPAAGGQDPAGGDPRQAPPLVLVAVAEPPGLAGHAFTGLLGARVQSDLAFRVGGKVTARLVDLGQAVRRGDVLARLDEKDLTLALQARRNAVLGARATLLQAEADEGRYRQLLAQGWASRQRYEATRAARDTARAALAAAEAEAEMAANELAYATLRADADGVVTQVLAEPGAVLAAGQPMIRLAQAGPREAVVNLPEGLRPALGTRAEVTVYALSGAATTASPAHLRQLADAADPASRTYEARFVLEGAAAQAPLGSTVTLRLAAAAGGGATVPLGALRDDGRATGVWVLDAAGQSVRFRPVQLRRLGAEQAVVEGVAPGERVAALGAQLLREGQPVRVESLEAAR